MFSPWVFFGFLRWTGACMCIVPCDGLISRMYSCIVSSVPGIGSWSTATLNRIKPFLKIIIIYYYKKRAIRIRVGGSTAFNEVSGITMKTSSFDWNDSEEPCIMQSWVESCCCWTSPRTQQSATKLIWNMASIINDDQVCLVKIGPTVRATHTCSHTHTT